MSGKGANNAPSDKQATAMAGPWQPLQDPYKKLVGQIGKQKPWEYGPGVVAGMDPTTAAGIAEGTNLANRNAGALQGATDLAGFTAGGGYIDKGPGVAGVAETAKTGVHNPAYDALMHNLNIANQGSGGMDFAQKTAAGEFLGGNPHLDNVINNATADANRQLLPALEGRMAMSGRMGSNAEAVGRGDIAKKLGEIGADIRYRDYSSERGMQNQAGLALPGLLGQELAARGGAADALGSEAYRADATKRDAAQQFADMQNQQVNTALNAGSQLGSNFQNQFIGSDRQIDYGNMNQAQQERERAEAQDRFQFGQSAPYENISRQLGQYGQIAGVTNPAQANAAYAASLNRPSGFQQGVGNALGLAGAGAQIGSMFFDPTGTTGRNIGAATGIGQQAVRGY